MAPPRHNSQAAALLRKTGVPSWLPRIPLRIPPFPLPPATITFPMPRTTRAVCIHETGPATDVLRVETQTLPDPGPGEAVVRVLAAPINPADINILEGKYGERPALPAVCGNEGAGVVETLGPGAAAPAPGTLVKLPVGAGSWREFLTCPAEALLSLPATLDPLQAAMLSVNPPTAWRMLHDFVELKPGDWIAQNAANSGVGRCAIAIAKHLGLRSVNLVRRPELEPELKALGAEHVLVEGPEVHRRIAEITGDRPPRLACNAVGGDSALALAKALAPGGSLVTYGAMAKAPLTIPNALLIFKDIRFLGFWLTRWTRAHPGAARAMFEEHIIPLAAAGLLRVPVAATYPIDRARDAVAHALRAERAGKVLFEFPR